MRKTCQILVGAMCAIALSIPAVAVDWQFTGATNRTAVVARTCVISSEFDSQISSTVLLSGCNMRSDAVGTLILFR